MKRAALSRRLVGLVLLAVGLGACESGFDRNDQIVNSVRILGVRAHVESTDPVDWADADVGDTVDFSALVTNPTNDPTLTVTWLACVPIPGQVSPCTYAPDLTDPTQLIPLANDPTTGVLLLGTGAEIQYTIPDDDVVKQLLAGLIMSAMQSPNAECGIYQEIPLLVIAQVKGQKAFTAQKNFRLSPWRELAMPPNSTDSTLQFYVRNANPEAGGLTLPASLDACQGPSLTTGCVTDSDCAAVGASGTCENNLCTGAVPFPAGLQTVCVFGPVGQLYFDCDLNGPINASEGPNIPEYPTVTWYMTAGSLAGFSGSNNGGPPSDLARTFTGFTRSSGPFTLYAVVRDGRDGESWVAQDFQ